VKGKGFFIAIALALAALIYFVFVKPLLISDEARIRKGLKEGVRAIEAEDVGKCLRHVSIHYQDEYGLTYLSVKNLLIRVFQDFDAFEIDLENLRVSLIDKRTAFATFDLRVKVSFKGQKAYLVGSGDLSNRIGMNFTKEGNRWKVTRVEGVEAHVIERT
jgi:hypothetical protein